MSPRTSSQGPLLHCHDRTCATPTATPVAGSSTAPAMPAAQATSASGVGGAAAAAGQGARQQPPNRPTWCWSSQPASIRCSPRTCGGSLGCALHALLIGTDDWGGHQPHGTCRQVAGGRGGPACRCGGRRVVGGGGAAGGSGAYLPVRPWPRTWRRSRGQIQCAWGASWRTAPRRAPAPPAGRLCRPPLLPHYCMDVEETL